MASSGINAFRGSSKPRSPRRPRVSAAQQVVNTQRQTRVPYFDALNKQRAGLNAAQSVVNAQNANVWDQALKQQNINAFTNAQNRANELAKAAGPGGQTNAPGVAGGAAAAPSLSPIDQETWGNAAQINTVYGDNTAKLQALRNQYVQQNQALRAQQQADMGQAQGITQGAVNAANTDLASQGASTSPIGAEAALRAQALSDANNRQQALLGQYQGIVDASTADRSASAGNQQAAYLAQLQLARQGAINDAMAAAAGGGGGGGGRGGRGGSGSSGGLSSSDVYLARSLLGSENYGNQGRQASMKFLGNRNPFPKGSLRAATWAALHNDPHVADTLLGKTNQKKNPLVYKYLQNFIGARNKGRSQANKAPIADILALANNLHGQLK